MKKLVKDLSERIEDETRRRPNATVDDIAEAVCQAVDDRLCVWIGPTQASAWWHRWIHSVTGEQAAKLEWRNEDAEEWGRANAQVHAEGEEFRCQAGGAQEERSSE